MILVDKRAGSVDLAEPLAKAGYDVELTTLAYGDLSFAGKSGESVGIEYKKLGELITSIRDGRFASHQLPGLKDYDFSWLLWQGSYVVDKTGLMCHITTNRFKVAQKKPIPGSISETEFQKHLLTYQLLGGIYVDHTPDQLSTLKWIGTLYRWFTDRRLDEHTSHLQTHRPASFAPLSPFRQAVTAWPGVGVKTSLNAELRFSGSIRRAATATVAEWAAITSTSTSGRISRFGESAAHKLDRFLEGEANGK